MHPCPPKDWGQVEKYVRELHELERSVHSLKALYLQVWGQGIIRTRIGLWSIFLRVRHEKQLILDLLKEKAEGKDRAGGCSVEQFFDFRKWGVEFILASHELLEAMNQDPQGVSW